MKPKGISPKHIIAHAKSLIQQVGCSVWFVANDHFFAVHASLVTREEARFTYSVKPAVSGAKVAASTPIRLAADECSVKPARKFGFSEGWLWADIYQSREPYQDMLSRRIKSKLLEMKAAIFLASNMVAAEKIAAYLAGDEPWPKEAIIHIEGNP